MPSRGAMLEANLAVGRRKLPWPGTEHQLLVDLIGTDAAGTEAEELDKILSSIVDVPGVRDAKSLADVARQATALAKARYPDFNDSLCSEIGRYASFIWR